MYLTIILLAQDNQTRKNKDGFMGVKKLASNPYQDSKVFMLRYR